ncbi:uncharacterized protein [Anabrus simplex]|uniref:uncharacterized protein n=1 Tax=Anabrus simplex TaxID=316456 RepID=UPI0034DCE3B7
MSELLDSCKLTVQNRAVKAKKRLSFEDKNEDRKLLCERKQKNCREASSSLKAQEPSVSHKFPSRVTRSVTKEWLGTSGCKDEPLGAKINQSSMKPPCLSVPLFHVKDNNYSGIITRRRYRSMLEGGRSAEFYRGLKGVCCVNSRLSFDHISNTSEYGTASDSSKNCSVEEERQGSPWSACDSCHCDSVSGVGSMPSASDDEGVTSDSSEYCKDMEPDHLNQVIDLSQSGWDSDGSAETEKLSEWDCPEVRDVTDVVLIRADQVTAIIPTENCNQYQGEFKIQLMEGNDNEEIYRYGLYCGMRVHHVSPVVSMEPHGVQFFESSPALLVIPLRVIPQDETWLACLYSNTSDGQLPQWERLPKKDYSYRSGCLVIMASHFSLFTVILEEPFPEVMKHIRCRSGGRMRIAEVPGVEVEFPRGCLEQDIDAYVRVLYDSEPSFGVQPGSRLSQRALASPIIMLGPHYEFKRDREPVRITLPVPDYEEIVERFGPQARLSVWQSSPLEGEPMVWERLEVPISKPRLLCFNNFSVHVVSFPVHHFSFFKVVWDLLVSSLYEAKMGMSFFYPYISFSMMCQAFMEESAGDNRFGLEVICYRSDRRLPEATNYRHRVGASLKPKLVRPGRILVRLRSQMFEADVEAGEDKEMEKEEPDFRGRDFEKQYACRFKPNVNVERGTFGKVIVERIVTSGKDPLFEFNLHKTGHENEASLPVGCGRWTLFAMKELASSLQITEGSNWKKFAQYIGFTKNEIKSKLQYSEDPFVAMMNLYDERGGTPQEFTQALYAVSRELRLGNSGMLGSNNDQSSSRSEGSRGSGSKVSSSQGSAEKANQGFRFWGFHPWSKPQGTDSGESSQNETRGKKRSRPSSNKKTVGSSAKRRKFSDISETVTSSSSDDDGGPGEQAKSVSTEYKTNPRKLTDRDLWRISSKIVRKDWRNLGRTLGIEEQVLVNIEHSHQSVGFRECAYQMLLEWKGRKPRKCTFGELYKALLREDMVVVAKYMVNLEADAGGGDD